MKQPAFKFSFILQGRFNAEQQMDLSDNLIEAGCDYPEVSAHNDIITLEFFHEDHSDDYRQVILDEMHRVESTGVFISSLVESDAVTVSDIAERSGINKMTISRYSRQQSGGEDFPAPFYGEKWSWAEVTEWLSNRDKLPAETCIMAEALRDTGNAIRIRGMMRDMAVTNVLKSISNTA